MKKNIFVTVLTAIILGFCALAYAEEEHSPYVRVGLGTIRPNNTDKYSSKKNDGYFFSAGIGNKLEKSQGLDFRTEFEILHTKQDYTLKMPYFLETEGTASLIGGLGNLYMDFNLQTFLTPFLCLGIGIGHLTSTEVNANQETETTISGTLYQLGVGVKASFSKNLDTYIAASSVRLPESDSYFGGKIVHYSFGIIYSF